MSNQPNEALSKVLEHVNLVVYQTRIVTPIRDTGEGKKIGSRIEKVLQACFDPTALRPHAAKKQEANRLCRLYGTRVETLNAWAVPLDRTHELMEQLGAIAKEWDKLTIALAGNMTTTVENWAQANPTDSSVIKQLAPTAQDVRDSTRFIYTSFRLQADQISDPGCLEQELLGLAGQTLHEFTQIIRDASLHNDDRTYYSQASKEALVKIATKAQSLAFLDPILAEVANVLNSTLAVLPTSGQIADAHAVLLKSVIDQLMTPRTLMRVGFRKMSGGAVPSTKKASGPANPAVKKAHKTTKSSAGVAAQSEPAEIIPAATIEVPNQAYSW